MQLPNTSPTPSPPTQPSEGIRAMTEPPPHLEEVIEAALAALDVGGTEEFPLKEGRVVKVLASPTFGTSAFMSMGLAVLPPNYTTPPHEHDAEEIALVLRGSGSITVAGVRQPVRAGSVVIAPPLAPHTTQSGSDEPMVVYWTYGPAGSESRWISEGAS